jgi:flagellar motor switch protein FliG
MSASRTHREHATKRRPSSEFMPSTFSAELNALPDSCTPIERIAWLLSCLPDSVADRLLCRLPAMQAANLRGCAAGAPPVELERLRILERFLAELAGAESASTKRRIDAAGAPAALHIMQRALPSRVASLLANELPQTAAAILGSLPASKAADILTHLPREVQRAVAVHMRDSETVSAEVISDLITALCEQLADSEGSVRPCSDARRQLDAMLDCADAATREYLADGLSATGS